MKRKYEFVFKLNKKELYLHQLTRLEKPVLCVDPVAELLFQASELHNIRILPADVLEFINMKDIRFVKIYLMKKKQD